MFQKELFVREDGTTFESVADAVYDIPDGMGIARYKLAGEARITKKISFGAKRGRKAKEQATLEVESGS